MLEKQNKKLTLYSHDFHKLFFSQLYIWFQLRKIYYSIFKKLKGKNKKIKISRQSKKVWKEVCIPPYHGIRNLNEKV